MKQEKWTFRALDIVYITMMVLPVIFGIVFRVLTKPLDEGVSIAGAQIYFSIPMPLQDFLITESQINSVLVLIVVFGFCLFMTHGLKTRNISVRQHIAEWIVEKVDGLVDDNMGAYFKSFSPFIISILALSAFSSFLSLVGLYPPTSDLNIVAGWAIMVFFIITYYKLKCGVLNYLKGFTEPVAVLTPINFIGEFATPVSMAFRHYGNVLSGSVIAVLIAYALQSLSKALLGWLPGILADIPLLQVGLPAVLSIYFDVFSGGLQAYIFAMLTMTYVAGAFDYDTYKALKTKKQNKIKNKKAEVI